MLQRLADEATELILQQFAASRIGALEPGAVDARTLYTKFAFVKALLDDESFEGSMQQVVRRPHHAYLRIEESVHPSRGVRSGRLVSRGLTAPGRRVNLPEGRRIGTLTTVPENIERVIHEETIDTIPNRFVKYALESWRDMADVVLTSVGELDSAAAGRGRSRGDAPARAYGAASP